MADGVCLYVCVCVVSGYLLTLLITYSMVQFPSQEANWCAANQEFRLVLLNPNFHYRSHKRPHLSLS